ncbi:nitrate- and nitrite sensing domain-containing protein [Pokkaliibacter sp. CJK22405]|uniref:nitrate- and nitrite sensing domain-containing protein n=1 Tax=Pokkaliibacter sp. CJK22405 TaxID=3384615 RepID=UPI003984C28D
MTTANRDTVRFILMAKQAEIESLHQLATTCEMVSAISDLIHQLQRERGASNIFLASGGAHFADQLEQQSQVSSAEETRLRLLLDQRYLKPKMPQANVRLLNSVALVLHGLDELPALRQSIRKRDVCPSQSTESFIRLIRGLLAVVFETADIATDPAITRLLVTLFHLMQGKEYAGQERAWGAVGFAAGKFTQEVFERIENLLYAQQRCLGVFESFDHPQALRQWQDWLCSEPQHQFEQLRRLISGISDGMEVSPELSEVWYDMATQRIDQLRQLEDLLASALRQACETRMEEARLAMSQHTHELDKLLPRASDSSPLLEGEMDAALPLRDGGEPLKLMYELMQQQSEQIKEIQQELTQAKQALEDRKLIERAKGVLMRSLQLSEQQAYTRMRQSAMSQNVSLGEIAVSLLNAAERVQKTGT